MSSELVGARSTSKATEGQNASASPRLIREQSFADALRAVNLYRHLQAQKDGAGWVLGKQFLRAACSIGANVEEAQSGQSRADFIHKLGIAQKEARENLYWLRLISETETVPRRQLESLIRENQELTRILASIILTTKRKGNPHLDDDANSRARNS
jgi:four helix bundle protein